MNYESCELCEPCVISQFIYARDTNNTVNIVPIQEFRCFRFFSFRWRLKAVRMAHKIFFTKRVFNQMDGFSCCTDAVVAESVLLIALCVRFDAGESKVVFFFGAKSNHQIEFCDIFPIGELFAVRLKSWFV